MEREMYTHHSTVRSIASSKSSQWIEGPMNECSSALVIREMAQMCMHSAFLGFNIRFRWSSSMSLSLSVLCPLSPYVSISLYVSLRCTMTRLLSKRKEKEGAMDNIGNDLLSTWLALSFSLLFAHPFPCPLNSVYPLKMSNMSIKKRVEGL